jgi:hypothetical protein
MRRLFLIFGVLLGVLAQGDVTGIITPPGQSGAAVSNGTSTWTPTQAGNTSTDGIILNDTTAAATGSQQFSPRLRLTGQGWKTTATAASQETDWIIENQPVQGTTNPTSNLVMSAQVNGGGYTQAFILNSSTLGLSGVNSVTAVQHMYAPGFCSLSGNAYCLSYETNDLRLTFNNVVVASYGAVAFTVSGCGTAGSIRGHGTAGTFTVGTGAATCTFVFTINGATGLTTAPAHGWIANVDDVTANQHCFNNGTIASTTTATVLCNATVTTGDLITFSAVPF